MHKAWAPNIFSEILIWLINIVSIFSPFSVQKGQVQGGVCKSSSLKERKHVHAAKRIHT